MPTLSPNNGLSGLEGSGENVKAPECQSAQAAPQSGKTARLATEVAKRVGPFLAIAGLATAPTACGSPSATPAPDSTPAQTPTANPSSNPFDGNKVVCANKGMIDNETSKAAENYRRMFVQMNVSGQQVLYEPCAESQLPNELGKFVTADCQNTDKYRTCVIKDSYKDNSNNTVNTETRVNWLLTDYNKVESASTVGFTFPAGLKARIGSIISDVDPSAPVVYGQRRILNRQKTVEPTPVVPTATAKKIVPPVPSYDPAKDKEQDRRLDNLEAQVAYNTAKNNEQDRRLDDHGSMLRILIQNNKPTGNPHPTDADYDSLGRSRATK